MKWLAVVPLLLVTLPLQPLVRESSSGAELRRGMAAYRAHDYDNAVRAFARAGVLSPSARALFDEGTARIAQGDLSGGSALLQRAMNDPALRAAALYNRGTGELRSKAWESAINDLSAALRLQPGNRQAKQNLELALQQKQKQEQQKKQTQDSHGQGQQKSPSGSGGDKESQQKAEQGSEGKPQNDPADALLRSVQQQEEEELARMRKSREERRAIGW